MKTRALLLAVAGLALTPVAAQAQSAALRAAVAAPDRPDADKARDANRKPAEILAFAGVRPGQKVADLIPGGGYFTRVFSKAVGPRGQVFAVLPAGARPQAGDAVKAIAAEPGYRNVSVVTATETNLGTGALLDLAFTAQNYHDLYGKSPDVAARFDAAVFASLKRGGTYLVIDHVANAGDVEAPGKQHRIDPALVKAQVLKAGFVFVGESDVIRNAADDHAKGVFDASVRGQTDQFVYKFRKP
jgi:predicted methyltransferase